MIDSTKNISKVTYNGSDMPLATQSRVVTPTTEEQIITGDDGYTLTSVTVEAVTKDIDSNIQSGNIKQGVSILGVKGVLDGNKLPDVLNKTVTSLTAGDFIGVTQIPSYAFENCIDLTSVEFSSILQTIGSYAFYGCSGLTSISLPSSLKAIASSAFDNCSGLKGELNLGGCTSLASIGGSAFYGCSGLTSISLPSSLKAIASSAFDNCSGLKGELNLGGCTSLASIGGSAFYGCSGFTDLILPEGLKSIGDTAFYGCSGLTGTLDLSNCTSLTSIGRNAFNGCSGLTSITLPSSLTSIGSQAFRNCTSLTTMRVEATTPPTLSNTNAISTATTRIEVPMASVDAYKAATNWSNFADIIVGYTE